MINKLKSGRFHSLVAVSLLMASCASTVDPNYAITKDELETMRTRQAAHTVDGALKGAAVGSIMGAGMAALHGGNKRDIENAAIEGGVAGGVAGGVLGFQEGDKKGKKIVQNKRDTKSIQADIADRTRKAREATLQAQGWLKKMQSGVASGKLTGSALKDQREKAAAAIDASIKNLELTPELKGGAGSSGLQSQLNTLKNCRQQIAKVGAEGTVQKVS